MPTLLEQIIPRRKLMLIASETVIFTAILLLGTSLPPLKSSPLPLADLVTARAMLSCLIVAILCQASLSYNDLYDWKVSQNRTELPNRLLHSGGYALVMLSILVFLIPAAFQFPGMEVSETWKLILLLGIAFAVVYGWRQGFHWFFFKWNFGERVLVIGTGPKARSIATLIHEHAVAGFEVIGLSGPGESAPDEPQHHQILGSVDELADLCHTHRVARLVAALEERRGTTSITGLLQCRTEGVIVEERETMYERIAGKIAVESLRPSYLIFGGGFDKRPLALAMKRAIDVIGALVGVALALPVCVIVAPLIVLDSRGGVFFRQERTGQEGRVFKVLKFRTMRRGAEADTGPVWAAAEDPRVTRVGKWLRLLRIDEIPQMLNVLAGHMSFVGPRPERPFFVKSLSEANPFYTLRHTVRPGITGWAQVNCPYGASTEDALEKLRYDLYYIKNMSILFDLNIILRTVGVVLFGKGAR